MGDRCGHVSDDGDRCARPAGHSGYHRSDGDPPGRWGRPDLTAAERDLLHGLAWDAMGQAGGLDRDDLARLGELAERAWHELDLLHEEVAQLRLVRELASVASWGVDALASTVPDPSVWPVRLDELWAYVHEVVDHGEPADPDRIARLQQLVDQSYNYQRPDAIPGSAPPEPDHDRDDTIPVALEAEGTRIFIRDPRGGPAEIVRRVPGRIVAAYRDARTRLDRARDAVLTAAGYHDLDGAWRQLMDEQAALLDPDDDGPVDP